MISFLSYLLIQDRDNTNEPQVRQAYGMLCGAVGICLNVLLFLVKAAAGLISGSIAITADAFNNLSDAGSSVITLVGFKMAGQKADSRHPFGHGRIEYIAGFLVSVLILAMGLELLKSSVEKILHPVQVTAGPLVLGILVFSICVKLYMAHYNGSVGKRIQSAAMGAAAKDSISDSISTIVVLLTTLFTYFTDIQIDGWCGILVAVFVLWTGFQAARETISPLLGQPPSPEFVQRVEEIIWEYGPQGVLGLHDLVVHNYGPGQIMLSVHVEIPASGDILLLHEMIDEIEHRLARELSCSAVIHMDPVCVDDAAANELKTRIAEIVADMEGDVKFHDFRVVRSSDQTRLIFDVMVPYGYRMSSREVTGYLQEKIRQLDESYVAVIDVDEG